MEPSRTYLQSPSLHAYRSLGTKRVNFVRTLVRDADWPRFLKYAFRIKSLVCRDPEQEFGVPDLLQVYDALRQGVPEDHLLPNLEMLYWYHVGSGYAQFIDLLLGPKIASIQVIDRPSTATLYMLL
jgi:hypothetical protein